MENDISTRLTVQYEHFKSAMNGNLSTDSCNRFIESLERMKEELINEDTSWAEELDELETLKGDIWGDNTSDKDIQQMAEEINNQFEHLLGELGIHPKEAISPTSNSEVMIARALDIHKLMREKALWKYNDSKYHVQTSESGLHSDLYLNTDYLVSNVPLVEEIIRDVFSRELNSRNIKPDWIITYPPFGLPIAYAFAREIGAKFGYVDTKAGSCNFDIKKSETVIVVGDDIYSGGSIKKTISVLRSLGAKVKSPIFSIGNFSGTKNLLDLEVVSAISERGNLYEKKDCPMCKEGSKAVLPRPNWNKLLEELNKV